MQMLIKRLLSSKKNNKHLAWVTFDRYFVKCPIRSKISIPMTTITSTLLFRAPEKENKSLKHLLSGDKYLDPYFRILGKNRTATKNNSFQNSLKHFFSEVRNSHPHFRTLGKHQAISNKRRRSAKKSLWKEFRNGGWWWCKMNMKI